MPIVAADIKYYKSAAVGSGGIESLGGAITGVELTSGLIDDLFDVVSGSEARDGDIEYRCIYVQNTHPTLTLQVSECFISSNTPSTDTSAKIGLGSSGVGGIEQTVADESTAPVGVVFDPADGDANALSIGDIPAGSWKSIWIERTVDVLAGAYDNDGVVISTVGETAA